MFVELSEPLPAKSADPNDNVMHRCRQRTLPYESLEAAVRPPSGRERQPLDLNRQTLLPPVDGDKIEVVPSAENIDDGPALARRPATWATLDSACGIARARFTAVCAPLLAVLRMYEYANFWMPQRKLPRWRYHVLQLKLRLIPGTINSAPPFVDMPHSLSLAKVWLTQVVGRTR